MYQIKSISFIIGYNFLTVLYSCRFIDNSVSHRL